MRRSATCALRCSASPPADRRRPSRSCPGRRPAGSASRTAAPCARWRRRPTRRRAGGICRSRRRRRARTSCRPCSSRCRARASRTARGGAPASGRRARRAAPVPRSRSWRNRDRTCASRLRDLRAIFRVRSRPCARVRVSLQGCNLSGFKGGETWSQHAANSSTDPVRIKPPGPGSRYTAECSPFPSICASRPAGSRP